MYNYLATLRLQDGDHGHTLTVGPMRRVVFKNAIFGCNKAAVKRALRPLTGYWSKPSEDGHTPGSAVQKGVRVMSFYEFRLKAKQLEYFWVSRNPLSLSGWLRLISRRILKIRVGMVPAAGS